MIVATIVWGVVFFAGFLYMTVLKDRHIHALSTAMVLAQLELRSYLYKRYSKKAYFDEEDKLEHSALLSCYIGAHAALADRQYSKAGKLLRSFSDHMELIHVRHNERSLADTPLSLEQEKIAERILRETLQKL